MQNSERKLLQSIDAAKAASNLAHAKLLHMFDCLKEFAEQQASVLSPVNSSTPVKTQDSDETFYEPAETGAGCLVDEVAASSTAEANPKPASPKPSIRRKLFSSYDKIPEEDIVSPSRVRGKKRKNLAGHVCNQCSGFFKASGLPAEKVSKMCRHKAKPCPPTPPNYWHPGWWSPPKKDDEENK